jgi:hypothetical protein
MEINIYSNGPDLYTYYDNTGKNTQVTFSSAEVPEPATIIIWSLLGASWAGLGIVRRRRHSWTPKARTAIVAMIEHGRN